MASHIETLRNSMRRNNHTPFCFSWNYDNVIGQYVHQQWKTYLRGEPLILQFMCMSASSFGNYLGFYLYNLGCAMHSGTHFVVVHKEFDHKNYLFTHNMSPQLTSADYQRNPIPQHLFFQLLPSIFVHNTPSSYDMSRHIARRDCTCKSFCWEHAESFRNVFKYQWIGKLLCNVVSKYVRITRALEKGTRLASYDSIMLNRTIVSALYLNPLGGLNRYAAQHKSRNPDEMRSGRSESSSMILPLVPNVLIQYRCGDNLNLGMSYICYLYVALHRIYL
ncbi:hypothetical protein EON65_04205 [archaeon]|nr:MAG: hypothetical protein EON65_04205 [archaeon]